MQEESKKDFGSDGPGLFKYWLAEYQLACKREATWSKQGDNVIKKYEDDRPEYSESTGFNILWSNTETLLPAMYSRTPKPVVSRRFKDDNELGIQASRILQRALEVCLDSYDFDSEIRAAVQDRLLPGRGQARVRYIPKMEQTPVPLPVDEQGQAIIKEGQEVITHQGIQCCMEDRVVYEEARVEYVYWKHFKHGPGRVWREVPWVSYDVYLSRDQAKKRFGTLAEKLNYNHSPDKVDEKDNNAELFKQVHIVEIWSKTDQKVIWISPDYKEGPLDTKAAPISFRDGCPSPKPLLSVTTTKSLIPIPEYKLYQDQAKELDKITARLDKVVDAIKVRGLYAGDAEAIPQLLQGENNELIPVRDWMAYIDKGGVDSLVSWLPVDQLTQVAAALYEARDRAKEVLYELTGISDIVRGASNPNETLGAQKIKGRYAAMRFDTRKESVAHFVRDIIRLKAEIIAEQFSPKTLALMTGMEVTDEVMELLRNDPARSFMIDIETDSTIAADEMEEKERRTEFLTAVGGFMEKAVPLVQQAPQMTKIAGEMLLFAVRGFRAGRELESSFEDLVEGMGQEDPQQNPAMLIEQVNMLTQQNQELQEAANTNQIKANTDIQIAQMKMQAQQVESDVKLRADIQIAQIQAEADIQIAQLKEQGELGKAAQERQSTSEQNANARAEIEREIADIRANAEVEVAKIMEQAEAARVQLEVGPPAMPDIYVNIEKDGNKTIKIDKGADGKISGATVEAE